MSYAYAVKVLDGEGSGAARLTARRLSNGDGYLQPVVNP